jgi:hypothetical protein
MCTNILVGVPEGNKRSLRRPRRRRKGNIKMYLNGIRWEGVEWIHLAQGRHQWWALVNTVINLWVP